MDKHKLTIGGGIIILILLVLAMRHIFYLRLRTREDEVGIDTVSYKKGSIGVEKFTNLEPASINYKMGEADGIKLNNCPESYWRHPPANERLISSRIYVPQGNSLPLGPNTSLPVSSGPTVDGTKNTPNDMFMFAYNECRPECCPSTYSCDKGCVCTTEQQRKFIGETRGNNKTIPDNNQL